MGRGDRHIAPILVGLPAVATAGFLVGIASAETMIVRPGPCAGQSTYLLAGNAGALVRADGEDSGNLENHVIVFRRRPTRGWASQRLLKRFDLKLNDNGARVLNSGAFCIGTK